MTTLAKLRTRLGTKAFSSTGLLKKRLGVGMNALNSELVKKLTDEAIKRPRTIQVRDIQNKK